ncbi:MAG: hypothetical protein ACREOO_09170, partial [bacterium]
MNVRNCSALAYQPKNMAIPDSRFSIYDRRSTIENRESAGNFGIKIRNYSAPVSCNRIERIERISKTCFAESLSVQSASSVYSAFLSFQATCHAGGIFFSTSTV